jgi:hypothetical protein
MSYAVKPDLNWDVERQSEFYAMANLSLESPPTRPNFRRNAESIIGYGVERRRSRSQHPKQQRAIGTMNWGLEFPD